MELTDDSEKWIKHYSSRHKILLVGEGDFSFAASLARAFGNASNMVATSLDTECKFDLPIDKYYINIYINHMLIFSICFV